jgi:hypothetical protein
MAKKINNQLPLTCDWTAIDAAQREHHQANTEQLLAAVQATQELPEGYAFRFSAEPDLIIKMAEFIALERLCCPFFTFVLEVKPAGGPLWLKLTGRPGVKQFLQAEFGLQFDCLYFLKN